MQLSQITNPLILLLSSTLYVIEKGINTFTNSMCTSITLFLSFCERKGMWCPSLHTYLLTSSMEQSPSSASNWFSASQIPCILWNPQDRYCINKCQPPVPILSRLDPLHAHTFHFLKIHLNIMLPSMPGSPKWSLCLRFPPQKNPYMLFKLSFPCKHTDIGGK